MTMTHWMSPLGSSTSGVRVTWIGFTIPPWGNEKGAGDDTRRALESARAARLRLENLVRTIVPGDDDVAAVGRDRQARRGVDPRDQRRISRVGDGLVEDDRLDRRAT